MHFLSDVYVKCEECEGKRFNTETLEVKYKNNNISDILELSVDEQKNYLEQFLLFQAVTNAKQVGLGYIKMINLLLHYPEEKLKELKLQRSYLKNLLEKLFTF